MEGKKTGPDTRLMAEENDPQEEPSMEDILASIRRILSEDEQEETSVASSADPGVDLASDPAQTPESLSGSESELVPEPDMATASEEMAAEGMEEELISPAPEPKTVVEKPETVPQELESALVSETQTESVPASESAAEIPASSSSSISTPDPSGSLYHQARPLDLQELQPHQAEHLGLQELQAPLEPSYLCVRTCSQ